MVTTTGVASLDELVVALVGSWSAIPQSSGSVCIGGARIQPCAADESLLRGALDLLRPSWLLLGEGAAEQKLICLAAAARRHLPHIRLAVLGPEDDADRCEQWARRGARVYLPLSKPLEEVLDLLRASQQYGVVVVGECFQLEVLAEQAEVLSDLIERQVVLTDQEREVIARIRRHLGNRAIATELQVSIKTVEYHVSHILGKLEAKNRHETVERATSLCILGKI